MMINLDPDLVRRLCCALSFALSRNVFFDHFAVIRFGRPFSADNLLHTNAHFFRNVRKLYLPKR
jgi:hypothetical protein